MNKPNLVGVVDNYITYSDNYGDQYQRFNGIDVNVTARPRSGLTMQGGYSAGKSVSDNCEIREKVPETNPLNPYCHIETSMLPQYKAIGSYVIPVIDVQTSVTFTSKPGINVSLFGTPVAGGAFAANYTLPTVAPANSPSAPSVATNTTLGRAPAGGVPNITVNLVEPHSFLGDRVNEMNLRLSKIFRFGRTKANLGIDIYNLLNSAAPLSYNQAFIVNGSWLTPTSVMSARFAKISMQFDF